MTASKDSSEFSIIKDLSALQAWVDQVTLRGFSISPPLQVGNEFVLAVCQGAQLSDCTCIHVPLDRVREVADAWLGTSLFSRCLTNNCVFLLYRRDRPHYHRKSLRGTLLLVQSTHLVADVPRSALQRPNGNLHRKKETEILLSVFVPRRDRQRRAELLTVGAVLFHRLHIAKVIFAMRKT